MADIEEVEDMPSVVHQLPCFIVGFGGKQGSWGGKWWFRVVMGEMGAMQWGLYSGLGTKFGRFSFHSKIWVLQADLHFA